MAWDTLSAARMLHIVAATLWVGGAFFMAFILGPHMRAAGTKAGPLMMTIMRRGGLSPFFMVVGPVAILAGLWTYIELGIHDAPFGGGYNTALTLGGALAVLALLHGATSMSPIEKKLKELVKAAPADGPPSPELAAKFQELGMRQGKNSAISAAMLAIALLLMAAARLF